MDSYIDAPVPPSLSYALKSLHFINKTYHTVSSDSNIHITIYIDIDILENTNKIHPSYLSRAASMISIVYLTDKMRATMRPYKPNTSAKMRIRIMPTNKRGCCAVPRTPASPTIPIANPAASPDRPTLSPAPRSMKPLNSV
eukprot:GHVN01103388.1.p1 GENE.GHVN01103388.1~~GHVN01103388.1.p1  ORF type:complete len:141 (+),score=7.64 GHVN01103388.1:533-955(+)